MAKVVKYCLVTLASVVALLGIGVGIIAATFDPNDYKSVMVQLVKDKTQRTLTIPGEIKLMFFPNIGADLGEISLSERDGAGKFVGIERAKLSLAVMPLLKKQVVVDQITLDGLVIKAHRFSDGKFNFSDLLARENNGAQAPTGIPGEAKPITLDVGGISIARAAIEYKDDVSKQAMSASNLSLSTGPIGTGTKSPFSFSADLSGDKPRMALTTNLKGLLALDQGRLLLSDLDISASGSAAALSQLQVQLLASSVEASGATLSIPQLSIKASANPGSGALVLDATGQVLVDLKGESARVGLGGKLDGNTFEAKVGLTQFSKPALTVDLSIDQLNLDRYTAKGGATTQSSTPGTEKPLDLSALDSLNASGQIRIGGIQVANLKASDVLLGIRAANGKLVINPANASLYGGKMSGSISAVAGKTPQFMVKQALRQVNVGLLLKDATGSQPVDGKGNIDLDVATSANVASQMIKGLNGSARLALTNGAINGINLAEAIRNAKSKLGQIKGDSATQQGTATAGEKTDFSELSASFSISKGIARNDDLSIKSPLFRIGGSGDINLGDSLLDYTVRATIVPTLEGQGGPAMQELKGLTVPVRLFGPFSAVSWRIDFASVANDLLKGKLDEKKAQVKARAQQQIDAQKDKFQDQLKGQLKGLFGR